MDRLSATFAALADPTRRAILARLAPFIAATQADEVMITTMIYDHAARRRSYELMAQAFELAPA